jgi:hypothetical protein
LDRIYKDPDGEKRARERMEGELSLIRLKAELSLKVGDNRPVWVVEVSRTRPVWVVEVSRTRPVWVVR